MSRLRELVNKGVRLIVAETPDAATPDADTAPPPPEERDLVAEDFALPELEPPAISSVPATVEGFGAVYDEAGVSLPEHGYGIDKVAEMLDNARLSSLSREVKASAVLAALEAAGVSLKDVLADALARDQTLDAFAEAKERELTELRAASDERIVLIREEIETFLKEKNGEIESLKTATEEASTAFSQLQIRKRREEDRLHEVASHFVEDVANPVTAGTSPGPAPTTPSEPSES